MCSEQGRCDRPADCAGYPSRAAGSERLVWGDLALCDGLIADIAADGRWSVGTIPTIFVDFRKDLDDILDDWKYCMDFPAKSLFSVKSSYEGGVVTAEVSMGVKEAGDYRIVAVLVQDGLIAYQKGYGEGYVHKNIVRDISDGGMFGNGDIPLAEGGQTEKTFSLTVQDGAYDVSDLSLVIYSLCNEDGNIVSDNSIRVPVGESTDYRYDD